MKRMLKEYFSFSKKEYNGFLILCMLLLGILLFPSLYPLFKKPQAFDFTSFNKEIKEFKSIVQKPLKYAPKYINRNTEQASSPIYFQFDPNNLSEKDWLKLVISKRIVQIIKNFESKGGHFYCKEDLQKIYGITPTQYALLAPYIVIHSNKQTRSVSTYKIGEAKNTFTPIDINEADSAKLETISGIGPAFASRIIKYRNRLGGFYAKEQLNEVYGLDSTKYEQIKNQLFINSSIKKININTANFDGLKNHPYLSYKQINAIIKYRKQYGSYGNLQGLSKVVLLSEKTLNNIAPYLEF